MKNQLVVFFVFASLLVSPLSYAQNQQPLPPQAGPGQTTQKRFGPKRQAAIIIFAGLGGAVMGLSTLSFYGRPQDKLSNIAIGAAVGIIVGTIYVTYKAATQPSEFYGEGYRGAQLDNPYKLSADPNDLVMGYRWEF